MNVDRIIVSTDDSPFMQYWILVASGWKKFFPEIPVSVAFVTDRSPDDPIVAEMGRYGDVTIFPVVEGIPIANQAKMSRHVLASRYGDEICMIEDMDTAPLQADFVERVESAHRPGMLLAVGMEVYRGTPHEGKFPISNLTAEGRIFAEIINPHGLEWEELLRTWVGVKVHDHKESVDNPANVFSDESLLRVLIERWSPDRSKVCEADRAVNIYQDWVDRSWWGIDRDKLFAGGYVTCNFMRFLDDNFEAMRPIAEYLTGGPVDRSCVFAPWQDAKTLAEERRRRTGLPAGQEEGEGIEVDLPDALETEPLVTAIISTYNSERFIRGCLEDLFRQTIVDRLQIVIVDSASEQNERAIVDEFRAKYPNIYYQRTKERETIYGAWSRAIKAARGKYISNANTDDRHRPDAYELMARALDQNADAGAVYADVAITQNENETWEKHTVAGAYKWVDFTVKAITRGCFFGPQPMWRRSVHDVIGLFDRDFVSAGDYDFAIRVGWKFGAIHLRETLGLYVKRPDSVEHREATIGGEESRRIQNRYRTEIPIEDIYPGLKVTDDPRALANALLDMGNAAANGQATDQAFAFYSRALQVAPDCAPAKHNMALLRAITIRDQSALNELIQIASHVPQAANNVRVLTGQSQDQLILLEPDHPVTSAAEQGRGVSVSDLSPGIAAVVLHVPSSNGDSPFPAWLSVQNGTWSQSPVKSAVVAGSNLFKDGLRAVISCSDSADLEDAFKMAADEFPLVLLISSKVTIPAGMLPRMASALSADPWTAAVGPRIAYGDGPQYIAHLGSNRKRAIQAANRRANEFKGQRSPTESLRPDCVLVDISKLNMSVVEAEVPVSDGGAPEPGLASMVDRLTIAMKADGRRLVIAEDVVALQADF